MKPLTKWPLLAACIVLAAVSSARADDTAGPDYVLGTDDVIEINVRDHPELTKTLPIMPDGKIAYPEAGELRAAGKTPAALAAEIKAELEKRRNNVSVIVTVITPKSLRVRVVGAVKSPGVFDFRRGLRVLDVIAAAGGLAARPARVRGRILRGAGEVIELSVSEAMAKPETDANAPMYADDLVLLDEMDPMRNKVYVMGRVAKPGSYELGDEGRSLLAVLAEAGNPADDAALTKCMVIRGQTEIPVNLLPALVHGKADDPAKSVMLQPGDMVFVPRNERTISVMGSVSKAGQFALSEEKPMTVIDALGLAGGPTPAANPRGVSVVRMVDGKPTVIAVDLDRIIKKRDFEKNITLERDDVIFVPAKGEKGLTVQEMLSPFMALYYLGVRIGR